MTGVITNGGLSAVVASLIGDDTVKYLGWGSGSGQGETATDLSSALAESRTSGTLASATTVTTDDTLRVTGTITATGARTVTEVGVFADPTAAELAIYGDFPQISLATGESIAFTIDVIVDQA